MADIKLIWLIVMCLEDINKHFWRDNFIRKLVHNMQNLVYCRRRKPHSQPYGMQPAQLGIVLFPVDIHKQQQPVELQNAFGLRF